MTPRASPVPNSLSEPKTKTAGDGKKREPGRDVQQDLYDLDRVGQAGNLIVRGVGEVTAPIAHQIHLPWPFPVVAHCASRDDHELYLPLATC